MKSCENSDWMRTSTTSPVRLIPHFLCLSTDRDPAVRSDVELADTRLLPQTYQPALSSDDPESSSADESSASSSPPPHPYLSSTTKPDLSRPKPAKPGRPPKDPAAREKKRLKKASIAAAGGGEGEGMHVCVTCGRTDSPEWRKGPLGPKTLCNVSIRPFCYPASL